jgi:cell division protein FtsB
MRWAKSRRAKRWVGKFDGVEGFSTLVHLSGVAARGEIGDVSSTAVPKSLKECAKMIIEQTKEIKDLKKEINTLRTEIEKIRTKSEKQREYAKKRYQNINL